MTRRGRRSRRRRVRESRRRPTRATQEYRETVRRADQVLAGNDVKIRPDNWQQLVLDWVAPHEPDHDELARYIAMHEDELGVAWAREILRLEVLFQADEYLQVVEHFDRALDRYPRCPVVESWVADLVARHVGDFWRARQMYQYAVAHLPNHAKPRYELGFISYLVGDFSGALEWFHQAAERVADDDAELGAIIFYNRGLVRYLAEGDREAAITDVREALRRRPDYAQAREAMRGLKGRMRLVPW